MSDVQDWSPLANANTDPSPDGFPEGMPPSGVNDSAREVMAAVRRFYDTVVLGTLQVGNATNADDAGLLEGQNSAYHLNRANHTGTQAPATISPQPDDGGLNASTLQGLNVQQIVDQTLNAVPIEIKGWDVSVLELRGVGTNFGLDNDTFSIEISPDGTRAWIAGTQTHNIYQLDLSEPYNIATAVYNGIFYNVATQTTDLRDFEFRIDGTIEEGKHLYVAASLPSAIHHYILSTPFDVSTAVFAATYPTDFGQLCFDVTWKPDGTKVFIVNYINAQVREYSVSTPWDLSTRSVAPTHIFSLNVVACPAAEFNGDGTLLFASANTVMRVYPLSTPWDLTTANNSVYTQFSPIGAADIVGMDFSQNGYYFYTVNPANNNVYQYYSYRILPK